MTENEKMILENLENKTKQHKSYLPFLWACKVVDRARKEDKIRDDVARKTVEDEIMKLRSYSGELLGWDCYNIPLVYTQVCGRLSYRLQRRCSKVYVPYGAFNVANIVLFYVGNTRESSIMLCRSWPSLENLYSSASSILSYKEWN